MSLFLVSQLAKGQTWTNPYKEIDKKCVSGYNINNIYKQKGVNLRRAAHKFAVYFLFYHIFLFLFLFSLFCILSRLLFYFGSILMKMLLY